MKFSFNLFNILATDENLRLKYNRSRNMTLDDVLEMATRNETSNNTTAMQSPSSSEIFAVTNVKKEEGVRCYRCQ